MPLTYRIEATINYPDGQEVETPDDKKERSRSELLDAITLVLDQSTGASSFVFVVTQR